MIGISLSIPDVAVLANRAGGSPPPPALPDNSTGASEFLIIF